jgi:hypothetical protein
VAIAADYVDGVIEFRRTDDYSLVSAIHEEAFDGGYCREKQHRHAFAAYLLTIRCFALFLLVLLGSGEQ